MAKNGNVASEQLRSLIERIERLEEEKANIASDIRDVYAEAKANGFDAKTMRQIIRLRKMDQAEREEHEALLDIYKAALGMLDGTPLCEAAIRKLSKKEEPHKTSQPDFDVDAEEEAANATETKDEEPEISLEEARLQGKNAALDGKAVTENPFPAHDPRRAAWDEEWCKASGSDGMELPAAWRRKSSKKGG